MEEPLIGSRLIDAYRRTDYIVDTADGAIVLRIGETSTELARMFNYLGVENAAFVTAWNPYSQIIAAPDSEAANRCLRYELRRPHARYSRDASEESSGIGRQRPASRVRRLTS